MNTRPRRRFQSGFSLIEILVTLVITAIGLLGFAAMMVQSMKNNRTAMQRGMATFYAYSIIDSMRVNTEEKGSYTREFEDSIPTGTTVVDADLSQWLTELSAKLPGGAAKISLLGNTVTVQIRWTESVNAADDATRTWKTISTL